MAALSVKLPRSVERIVRNHPNAREAVVDMVVRLLSGPGSEWPVRTGRSIRGWRRTGSGATSRIYNPVSYAIHVEEQTGAAAATIRRFLSLIQSEARAAVETGARGESLRERQEASIKRIIRAESVKTESGVIEALYNEFLLNRNKRGIAPRIPAWLTAKHVAALRQLNREALENAP